jgi:hypothetical protein
MRDEATRIEGRLGNTMDEARATTKTGFWKGVSKNDPSSIKGWDISIK